MSYLDTRSLVVPKIKLFASDRLNEIGTKLIRLDELLITELENAEKSLYSAFKTRWEYGKLISENYDHIVEECGTQKAFAETIGKSEATISNNKRGYENLLEQGAETWDDVKSILRERGIKPTVQNFEKIGRLLNDPDPDTDERDQRSKDEQRLLRLREEAEEILRRNEPQSHPEVHAEAVDALEDIEEVQAYLESFDPLKRKWKSEKYLNFVRAYGRDLITGKPCERCDPHHTTPTGGAGGMGEKLPDYYAIPVARSTHMALESGLLKVKPEDILNAQFECLSAYISLTK